VVAERVVANADIVSVEAVYDVLSGFFAEHSLAPRIEENATVSAFFEDAPEGVGTVDEQFLARKSRT